MISDSERLALVLGDLRLSTFEDELATNWTACLGGQKGALRVISMFWQVIQRAAAKHEAHLVLLNLGPSLGATTRAALISADFVTVPLSPDHFSLQSVRILGSSAHRWRQEWQSCLSQNLESHELQLPTGKMEPVGYIIMHHPMRLDRPVGAYERCFRRIPQTYRGSVLAVSEAAAIRVCDDECCIGQIKHYPGLIPMAQEARKPIFHLKPADGALGSHFIAVQEVEKHFRKLAADLALRIGVEFSS